MTSRTRRLISGLAATCVVAAGLATGALAQETENLGTHQFWTAWKGTDANGVICYISSQPQATAPTNVNRDPIHFMVIHRKGLGTRNEVQTLVGYPLQPNTTPRAVVDGRSFDMVLDGEAAWLAPQAGTEIGQVESSFVDAMKAGSEMVVYGTSTRGTNTTDTYSLLGVTDAMADIDEACA